MELEKFSKGGNYTGIGTSGKGITIDEVPDGVLNDIYADEKAVFGYLPKEGTAYSKFDFTNVDDVMKNRAIREDYIQQSSKIQNIVDEMIASENLKNRSSCKYEKSG